MQGSDEMEHLTLLFLSSHLSHTLSPLLLVQFTWGDVARGRWGQVHPYISAAVTWITFFFLFQFTVRLKNNCRIALTLNGEIERKTLNLIIWTHPNHPSDQNNRRKFELFILLSLFSLSLLTLVYPECIWCQSLPDERAKRGGFILKKIRILKTWPFFLALSFFTKRHIEFFPSNSSIFSIPLLFIGLASWG